MEKPAYHAQMNGARRSLASFHNILSPDSPRNRSTIAKVFINGYGWLTALLRHIVQSTPQRSKFNPSLVVRVILTVPLRSADISSTPFSPHHDSIVDGGSDDGQLPLNMTSPLPLVLFISSAQHFISALHRHSSPSTTRRGRSE